MLKKIVIALLIALPMSVFAQKFGIVDIDAVFDAMPETAAMQTQIGEASKQYEDEFAKLTEEFNKKYADYQALEQDPSISQSIKERRIQDLQDSDQKIQQFRNTAQQDLARMQQQLMAPIEQKLRDAIKAVGQEQGYTFIFPSGVALYEGAGVDNVTDSVKAKLGIK